MKIGMRSYRKQNKPFSILLVASAFVLMLVGAAVLGKQLQASSPDMTKLQFSSALFCQRVSQAINDSLGGGMADGSDCVNHNLYVSSAEISNIQTLDIVPPEGGFGDIDWDTQSISIGGDWPQKLSNLTSLSITNMYVDDISPLRNLVSDLVYLNLSDNRISDTSPLEVLQDKLVYLDLSGNPLFSEFTELSKFTKLTTLKIADTDIGDFSELFDPPEMEYDEETGEPLFEPETSSNLAKVLQVFDISRNENLAIEKDPNDETPDMCENTNLLPFATYTEDLVITELYASDSHLNTGELMCAAELQNLDKLDVSSNHIMDFSPIKTKTYSALKADSQVFNRAIESLDYSPLPELFDQASQANYFAEMPNATNNPITRDELTLDNAQFNGDKVRFINAVIASGDSEDSRPATVAVPTGSGVFENSQLRVYFAGQIVTFNEANLCNEVYSQGADGSAFYDADWNLTYSILNEGPVVLTNACDAPKKQIALIRDGSHKFVRLILDSINDGAVVDLTGLEEFDNLQVLSLQNDGLTELDEIIDNYQLKQLWLDDNNLDSEDWQPITDYFTQLNLLHLNNNYMSEISPYLIDLYDLANLYLVNNGISDVSPLANVSTLTVLDLSENELIGDISGMVNEESACNPSVLKLENTGLTRLPDADIITRGFSNLTSINLNNNSIDEATIANLAYAQRLDELYLNNNGISGTSSFSDIANLKKLFLDNNQITNISGLTSLTKLAELHLGNNKIGDISGLNNLPALATLDLNNQVLSGSIAETESTYQLPAVFSQAKTLVFPKVSNFQSTENYIVTGGSIDQNNTTATMSADATSMTVTIPDGSLKDTTITIRRAGPEFAGTIIDLTNGQITITPTSSNSFTITSDKTCMVLQPQADDTWSRLSSSPVTGVADTHEFTLAEAAGVTLTISYAGDANTDGRINVLDARRIVNSIMGKASLSNLEERLSDVDNNNRINVLDARRIVNSIMGKAEISW